MKDSLQIITPEETGSLAAYDNPIPIESSSAPASGFKMDKLWTAFRRFWWILLLTLLLGGGAAFALVRYHEPTFTSRATLWETEKFRLPEGAVFTEDVQTALTTHIELLKSSTIAELAFARLKNSGSNTIPLNKEGKPLKLKVNVTVAPKSSVIEVEVESPNPAYSKNYLTVLLDEFLAYRRNVRKSVSGETLTSISEQVTSLERDLKASQDALTSFEKTNNLAVLQEESATMGSYLTRLKLQISDLKLEAQNLENAATSQQGTKDTNGLDLPAYSTSANSSMNANQLAAIRDIQVLKMERDRLAAKLRPKHPKLAKINNDIERTQKTIDVFQAQNSDQLATARQSVQNKIANVQASINEWEAKVAVATARVAEADQLKLGITRAQSIYDRFVGLYQNANISRNISQETLSVLEAPSAAARVWRKEKSLAAGSVLGGFAFGAGIILLIAVRDDRLSSWSDASQNLNAAIVGQLPEMPKAKNEKDLAVIVPDDQRHMYAESLRNLRSALLYQMMDGKGTQIILVTSAVPGEGKSTVSANLATTMALGGANVILIDADLRKGKLHGLLGMEKTPGLSEILSGKSPVNAAIQKAGTPGLSFLAHGGQNGNPSDLFLTKTMSAMLEDFRKQYDHIIIDTCPVFAADAPTTLAPLVDGTLFVVRGDHTQAGMAREALDLLQQRHARILGVVFNGVKATAHAHYHYNYPEYYNS